MRHFLITIVFALSTSLLASAGSLVPTPNGPQKFEELIGKTLSLRSSDEFISVFYWETTDTLWIKPDGTTFSILLPIEISGVKNEYQFIFELNWVYDNPETGEEYLKQHQE